jgi:hypothetical protein
MESTEVSFSFLITALSCFALLPPTWTPMSAKGLPFKFFTSDRSWGHWARHVSQT